MNGEQRRLSSRDAFPDIPTLGVGDGETEKHTELVFSKSDRWVTSWCIREQGRAVTRRNSCRDWGYTEGCDGQTDSWLPMAGAGASAASKRMDQVGTPLQCERKRAVHLVDESHVGEGVCAKLLIS